METTNIRLDASCLDMSQNVLFVAQKLRGAQISTGTNIAENMTLSILQHGRKRNE